MQIRPSYIDAAIFKASLARYDENRLVAWLDTLFGVGTSRQLITEYYIGTSSHWDGSTVFWQVDGGGHIRAGKIMLYDAATAKRVKQPFNHISWVHSALNLEFNLTQCLFGEHLLRKYPDAYVCIVESEKTAIVGTGFANDAVWLATGGCQNLSRKMCEPLRGRSVILMPDNGKFDEWAERGRELLGVCKSVTICDLMERKATNKGDDICDLMAERHANGTLDQSIFDEAEFVKLKPKRL